MRIISGSLKGRALEVPKGSRTRPVTAMLQERLMSLFTPELLGEGRIVDICAGTGIGGFEAISRGAQGAIFVESSPLMARGLSQNAVKFGITKLVSVLRTDARRAAKPLLKLVGETQDISAVFMDPPFIPGMARDILIGFQPALSVLSPDARLILRTPDTIETPNGLDLIEKRRSGNAWLYIYGRS